MAEKKISHACPLCGSRSHLLKGSSKCRYFCIRCSVEFTLSASGSVDDVYEVRENGDLDKIKDWQEYVYIKK